jgi:hypothetical protein
MGNSLGCSASGERLMWAARDEDAIDTIEAIGSSSRAAAFAASSFCSYAAPA